MDTNQLAEALARAVEAAKPAQEYCFLWIDWWPMCMTKGEWSGWMQVLGSIVALAIAIALPYLQARQKQIRSFDAAVHSVLHQIGALRAVRKKSIESTLHHAFSLSAPTFDTGYRSFESVTVSDLPIAAWPTWQGALTTAAQIRTMANGAAGGQAESAYLDGVLTSWEEVSNDYLSNLWRHNPHWVASIRRKLTRKP